MDDEKITLIGQKAGSSFDNTTGSQHQFYSRN